jgi:type IV pilus assembly protein PilC
MNDFAYIYIDQKGKKKRGSMEASDAGEVYASIRAEGNIPISVAPQGLMTRDISISLGKPVKVRELSVFCRQFGSILSASIPILNALEMLSRQTENKALSKAILEVKTAVEKGDTLAGAMEGQQKIFPQILINMVRAGEVSGNLELALERMAVHFEREAAIKNQLKKAMIYPLVIALVTVVVIFIMMLVVIPNFVGMFSTMNIRMPLMTRMVIGISNFFVNSWYLILGLLIITGVFIKIYKRTPEGQLTFGKLGYKLPLFGKLMIKSASSRFGRTLSTLLSTGIPMLEALDITARTMDQVLVRQVLKGAREDVAKGLPLSVPLANSGIFPPMVCDMARIGEETGNLDQMLVKLADYYDEEVKAATDALMAALEPMIIIILALVVGILIMAIMQPMLKMYQSFGGAGGF